MINQYQFGNVIIQIDCPVSLKSSPVMEKFRVYGEIEYRGMQPVQADFADLYTVSPDSTGPVSSSLSTMQIVHLQIVIEDYHISKDAQYLRSIAGNDYYLLDDTEISVYRLPADDTQLMWLIMQPGNQRTLYMSPSAGEEFYSMHELLKHMELINMLLEHDVWVLHCCYVKTPQGAVLFTGNSGVGKSTQGGLWEKYDAGQVINGDRCVIYQENGRYMANGFVYSGSSGICENSAAPIRAIVLLHQSSINEIRPVLMGKGIKTLYLQTVSCPYRMEENDRKLIFATQLYGSVEMIQLNCRPDEEAVQVLQKYLWK